MRNEGPVDWGRVPARVLLRGGPEGWHYVVVDDKGAERRTEVDGPGTRWQTGGRRDPEPPWWPRRLAETAEGLRAAIAERLTDATFSDLGAEAAITWFAVDDPVEWEGLVTLREADPARFPGRVAPFVIDLEPGRGALLPNAHLLFSTPATDAWTTLAAVAERCGTPPPRAQFLCGWADHRSVRVGRGVLSLSTERSATGEERVAEICGTRRSGWSGNPEMRFRLDGIDLLDEPAGDVTALLSELGHEVVRRGRAVRLPALGLTLHEPDERAAGPSPRRHDGRERFAGVSMQLPASLVPLWSTA
ncbi:hypothetical protein [Actinomadura napierensis]|uniref:Uncharacterized protein n=1 Tax=Actinomadura napierensis TaxID=267854 RepID=A0ABN2Z106_9ACTN